MKIAFLFDVKLEKYENHYYAVNLGKELWEERYFPYFSEIVLVCRYRKTIKFPDKKQQADVNGIEVIAFEDRGIVRRFFNILNERKIITDIISDCDAVICRGFWGTHECRKLKKPYMIEVVSCLWDSMWNHSFLGKMLALPMFLSLKKAVKNADFVSYVTEYFLQSRYPTKGINIGVSDVITFPSDEIAKNNRYNKILKLNKNSIIKLGTTAAVNVAYKGQRYVIEALKILNKQGFGNIEYHLVGGGNADKLRKTAEKCGVADRVFFHGSLRHEEVVNFLDNIDIYVQPSLQEGLPRAVVEAMSRGLPCIGTNTGGIPELINCNYICKKGKNLSNEIAEKIIQLLKNESMRKMSDYSYNIAEKYEKKYLDKKRNIFMEKFVKYINRESDVVK